MKTKEEVIKESWGVVWFLFDKQEKETVIKNNGYYKGSNDDIFEAIDQNEHLFDFIAEKGSIPYSLEGIENNNGWIKIESEKDLPKEFCYCWIKVDNVIINGTLLFNPSSKTFTDNQIISSWNKITHMYIVTKPQPPLY